MKEFKVFVTFSIVLLMFSCSKDDEPDNTPILSSDLSVNQYHTDEVDFLFEFQNLSQGAVRYEWNFGDGNSSNSFQPNHIYDDFGKYKVELFAFDENNGVSSNSITITYGPHVFKSFIIDSAVLVNPINEDTLNEFFFHLMEPTSRSNFDLQYESMFPIEMDVNNRAFDLTNTSPKFLVQFYRITNNMHPSCSNFREKGEVMNTLLFNEQLQYNLEFERSDTNSCNGVAFTKLYGRFSINLAE